MRSERHRSPVIGVLTLSPQSSGLPSTPRASSARGTDPCPSLSRTPRKHFHRAATATAERFHVLLEGITVVVNLGPIQYAHFGRFPAGIGILVGRQNCPVKDLTVAAFYCHFFPTVGNDQSMEFKGCFQIHPADHDQDSIPLEGSFIVTVGIGTRRVPHRYLGLVFLS